MNATYITGIGAGGCNDHKDLLYALAVIINRMARKLNSIAKNGGKDYGKNE